MCLLNSFKQIWCSGCWDWAREKRWNHHIKNNEREKENLLDQRNPSLSHATQDPGFSTCTSHRYFEFQREKHTHIHNHTHMYAQARVHTHTHTWQIHTHRCTKHKYTHVCSHTKHMAGTHMYTHTSLLHIHSLSLSFWHTNIHMCMGCITHRLKRTHLFKLVLSCSLFFLSLF